MKKFLPLIIIFLTVFFLAIRNIIPYTFFTGWDNLHPEFNLLSYVKKIFFGAWANHQGLGAPAAQAQLSEITRLPLVFILNLLLPKSLVRYVFHFVMFFLGSLGIFIYLNKYWLRLKDNFFQNLIALTGAFYYLLNIYTLQQFYISFELFIVQFAFLPFLLISIHQLIENKKILLFILVNLLIAPSGHTPTVFYLGWIFASLYSFFVALKNNHLIFSLKKSFLVFFLIFFLNSYWIIPNLYYTFFNNHYVIESRANLLFNQESKWSIIEAGRFESLLTGIHYLFFWKDFNFQTKQYEYIFQEWINHFNQPLIIFFLITLNLLSLFGIIYSLIDRRKNKAKLGIIFFHLIVLLFLWMGVFFPQTLINLFYSSSIIRESFRNPFTKFQIIFSFTTSVMFVSAIENLFIMVVETRIKKNIFWGYVFILTIIFFIFVAYWPAFNGQLINEKLKTSIPNEYFNLYQYLNNLPENERILELPFFSDAGWVFYDWQNLPHLKGYRGYQGIGINFFGTKQPYLTTDFARWQETNDFFYHQLRYVINNSDTNLFKIILKKYHIPLVLLDKSMIDPTKNYQSEKLKKLIEQSGCLLTWQKNFLYLYRCLGSNLESDLIIPPKLINVLQPKISRTARDFIYENYEDYKNSSLKSQSFIDFPLADLFAYQLKDINLFSDKLMMERKILPGKYYLSLSNSQLRKILVLLTLKDKYLTLSSLRIKLFNKNNSFDLVPFIPSTSLKLDNDFDGLYVEFDNQKFLIHKNQQKILLLDISSEKKISINKINYKKDDSSIFFLDNAPMLVKIKINIPQNKKNIIVIQDKLKISVNFPVKEIDLSKIISNNCSFPKQGSVNTRLKNEGIVYEAESFGVNCNGFELPIFPSKDYSILLNVKGKNISGRSLKFFINYENNNVIDHDYLLPEKNFNSFFNILETSFNKKISVDWETRSFGKKSLNKLESIKLIPLPIEFLSNLTLVKKDYYTLDFQEKNNIAIKKIINLPVIKIIKTQCQKNPCYFGINQSYDRLWLAFNEKINFLPHDKINNWANIWQVDKGSHFILIFYLPSIISILCIISLLIFIARMSLKK